MDADQKLNLIDKLEEHDLLFKRFWNTTDIYFTDSINTAAVSFADNKISFLFNRKFWDSLPEQAQLFVVCHEQLHLLLNHFERLKFSEGDSDTKNRAADLCVNHMLIRNYGFDRTVIPEWEKYCWVDTVFFFPVSDNETAEYYYSLLKRQQEQGEDSTAETFDDHEYDSSGERPSKELRDALTESMNEHVEENTEGMSEQEAREWLEEYSKDFQATYEQNLNTEGMGDHEQEHAISRRREMSWKTIYVSVPKRILNSRAQSHWLNRNRRFQCLDDDLFLPGEVVVEKEDRVKCHTYLDTSGSCILHAKYFLESALSLPPNLFEVRMYGFGTRVYEISNEPPYKLRGFGNESYQAVEDHVSEFDLDVVLIFTDGYSKKVSHARPGMWHWFITPGGTTEYIDSGCHTYDLTRFNWKGRG